MKKNEKIKNGEGPSSGKKRGKETKVCFTFLICEALGFSDAALFASLAFFKVIFLLVYSKTRLYIRCFYRHGRKLPLNVNF